MNLKPVQLAYHVPDPEAVAHHYAKHYGWGPFFLLEHIALESCTYRGTPSVFDHSSAYGQAGEMMIELITQHNEGPSALRDMYTPMQTGIHHVAYFVPDLSQALAEVAASGKVAALHARTRGGVEFAMIDTVNELGHMLEWYEPRTELKDFYGYVRRKAESWDGSNPLRRITP